MKFLGAFLGKTQKATSPTSISKASRNTRKTWKVLVDTSIIISKLYNETNCFVWKTVFINFVFQQSILLWWCYSKVSIIRFKCNFSAVFMKGCYNKSMREHFDFMRLLMEKICTKLGDSEPNYRILTVHSAYMQMQLTYAYDSELYIWKLKIHTGNTFWLGNGSQTTSRGYYCMKFKLCNNRLTFSSHPIAISCLQQEYQHK